jgi:hypothetical protein
MVAVFPQFHARNRLFEMRQNDWRDRRSNKNGNVAIFPLTTPYDAG